MINRKNSYGKVIKVSNEDYEALHNLKFDLRVDTFDEVIEELLKEHSKQEVEA
ncbi:MAG: hypothetical protein ACYCSO_05270 [Cuniculiplasma sp.]